MPLNPSATELTTAATDAGLGVLYVVLSLWLHRSGANQPWKRALWVSVFGILAAASLLGAIAHGLDLSVPFRAVLWLPLYFSLGLSIALFLVGGIYDWQGEDSAQAALPWAIAIGAGFFLLTQWLGGAFVIFVVYEGVAMLAALAIYAFLWRSRRLPGAGLVAAGIGLSLVAAAVQASALRVWLFVPFDHNGLFHLVQLPATMVLSIGLQRGLADRADRSLPRSHSTRG